MKYILIIQTLPSNSHQVVSLPKHLYIYVCKYLSDVLQPRVKIQTLPERLIKNHQETKETQKNDCYRLLPDREPNTTFISLSLAPIRTVLTTCTTRFLMSQWEMSLAYVYFLRVAFQQYATMHASRRKLVLHG